MCDVSANVEVQLQLRYPYVRHYSCEQVRTFGHSTVFSCRIRHLICWRVEDVLSSTSSDCSSLSVSVIFSGELSPGRVFSCFWQSLHVYTVSNRLIQYSEYSMTASCKKVQTCYDATSNLQECMVQVWLCAILYCTTLRSYKIIRPFGIWAATASATASATATATENETESWNWKLKKTESSTWIFNLNIQLESSTWIFIEYSANLEIDDDDERIFFRIFASTIMTRMVTLTRHKLFRAQS